MIRLSFAIKTTASSPSHRVIVQDKLAKSSRSFASTATATRSHLTQGRGKHDLTNLAQRSIGYTSVHESPLFPQAQRSKTRMLTDPRRHLNTSASSNIHTSVHKDSARVTATLRSSLRQDVQRERRPNRSPSDIFLEERKRTLDMMRYNSVRKAKKAQLEKDRQRKDLLLGTSDSMPFKTPVVDRGHISQLFAPENMQNREVLAGDFVEVRRNGKPHPAIYVQDFDQSEGRLQSSSVGPGDQIFTHRTADVVFRIPGYLFLDSVTSKIGRWDISTDPQSPPKGSGRIAAVFASDATTIMGMHFLKFNTIYDHFWHHCKRMSFTTLEAAKFVFDKEDQNAAPLTLKEIYATHMYLTQDANLTKFIPSTGIRWTGEFTMRAPRDVMLLETVVNWLRTEDDRVAQFLEKCKKLIQSFRESGSDKSFWKEIEFTQSDQTIIEFVRQTAFCGYESLFTGPHLSFLPKLLRPLDAYEDIDPRTAYTFLNEIGVWPHWYNMEINRSTIVLTSGSPKEQAIMDRIRQLHLGSLQSEFERDITNITKGASTLQEMTPPKVDSTSIVTKRSNPLILESATEIYRTDPCDRIRHDFENMPVYAIDDPSASELDDAFSIEPVPITTLTPEPSTWVHVHVADPTSILPPFHELSLLAAERVQTTYLPERTYPMLPRALTEESLSLKNDGKPKKVMTFSGRIATSTGEILEYKVRPGIVRNLVTLNYDDVDEVLSWDRVQGGQAAGTRIRNSVLSTSEDALGDNAITQRKNYRQAKGSVSAQDTDLIQQMLKLQAVARQHMDGRLANGAFNFSMGRPVVEVSPFPLPSVAEQGWTQPIDFKQWHEPQITCRLDPSFTSPSRLMVAEYMIMGGRIAAQFSRERGLPMLYRGQSAPDAKYLPLFEEALKTKTDRLSGMLDLVDMLPLRPFIKGAEMSVDPLYHWSMGIRDGYCKVTSPLRRYADMVSHWQMKASLLGCSSKDGKVFGLDEMQPLASTIRDRERLLGMIEARSTKFWLYEMLRRKLDGGLDNAFEGVILNPTSDGYNVISSLLGFQCVVKFDDIVSPSIDTQATLPILSPRNEPWEVEGGEVNTSPDAAMAGLENRKLQIGDKVIFEISSINPQRPWIGARHLSAMFQ
ncbi:hypothetical protein BGZ94_000583 [Podila epigama]|nr:hypothetical protein BGZ94_000583 [Podila epigama]